MRLLLASPFQPPFFDGLLTERKTVLAILQESGDLAWCEDFVAVRLNGITIPREQWRNVTVKPEVKGLLELCVVPQKSSILPILATVALVALTAGIGAFGVPFLGAGFAAGSFGASAVAAGVGLAGQIAINALTAPSVSKQKGGEVKNQSQAGISGNQIVPLELLPTVHGHILASPPLILPSYTTWHANALTVHGAVGLEGRNLIENILINGNDIALLEGIDYETREGGAADAPLTLAQLTCIQQQSSAKLSQHDLEVLSNKVDWLKDQDTPANSLPVYHLYTTKGPAREIWLRFLCPSGMTYTLDRIIMGVLLRIELREKGSSTWRNCPTLWIYDENFGIGELRFEVKLKFSRPANGPLFGAAYLEYAVAGGRDIQGDGKTWEYQADAYFNKGANPADDLPVFTSATTSGVTITASTQVVGKEGWRACDNNFATNAWEATALPAWIKWDFGVGNSETYFSYMIGGNTSADDSGPKEGYLEGSNDDATWDLLSTWSSGVILQNRFGFIENPAAYRYYRFTTTENLGHAAFDVQISNFEFYTSDVFSGNLSGGSCSAHYLSINSDGAEIFLDPSQGWNPDVEYEVRVKRSLAFNAGAYTFTTSPGVGDNYGGGGGGFNLTYFFDYALSGSNAIVSVPQRNARSDMILEVFSTVSYDRPVDTTGITCIAFAMRNVVIDTVSAEFTSYASILVDGVWTDAEQPTTNPAALYRKMLLGAPHPNPPPAEIVNEDELAAWYLRCEAAGHECNFIQQGRSVAEVKAIIASTGYASPRESNQLSIVEDYDRSAEPISQMLSPLNTKLLGVNIPLPELEHAIYAEYLDEDDDYRLRRDIFYRDGFDAATASLFSTITYEGFTNATLVAARAAFDLKQVISRARTVRLEIGIEGYSLWRGKLVGHNDDVLNTTQAQGLIRSITESGGNVVSIAVDNIIPFSVNQDELVAFVEGLDLANATGVAIRKADGTAVVKTLTNVSDGNICTFSTPFPLSGSGLEEGLLCVFGRAGQEYSRMIVMGVEPQGLETRIVTLAAEAPELFA